MYEVEKYVFVWKDVPKPENTDRGVWKKSLSGSHRSFMSAEFAKEYKISYTVAYEDESVYKSDKENFDKDFSDIISRLKQNKDNTAYKDFFEGKSIYVGFENNLHIVK